MHARRPTTTTKGHSRVLQYNVYQPWYIQHPTPPVPLFRPLSNFVLPPRSALSLLSFRGAPQGLEMHGTTILCVRKNGKVVSLNGQQVLSALVHLFVIGLIL